MSSAIVGGAASVGAQVANNNLDGKPLLNGANKAVAMGMATGMFGGISGSKMSDALQSSSKFGTQGALSAGGKAFTEGAIDIGSEASATGLNKLGEESKNY